MQVLYRHGSAAAKNEAQRQCFYAQPFNPGRCTTPGDSLVLASFMQREKEFLATTQPFCCALEPMTFA